MTQHILVSGQVQGVGFRWSAARLAQQLGVTGTVQNLPSGQVAIVASGDAQQLSDFTQQLKHGVTPWAIVRDLNVTAARPQRFTDFRIITR
ncbi:acylphosphatase [Lactobacillus sp. HBUAS51381]|uniref:acylphosphatase n=1 Tax=Lactobacillaceae TaxID=33958 RepID=UPI001E6456D6|nr:acylphosphatase [Lactobacillus sp. HBUAS51381]